MHNAKIHCTKKCWNNDEFMVRVKKLLKSQHREGSVMLPHKLHKVAHKQLTKIC